MGGFIDANGFLTKSAILDKETGRLREEKPGLAGWQFRKGDSARMIASLVGKEVNREFENGDDTSGKRKSRNSVNRKADG